jgi:hypothetical protein
MITLVDLRTGAISTRPSDTRTLDVPKDFDPETAVATFDSRSQALYRAANGQEMTRAVHPRPLSWRVEGEECLVAEEGVASSAVRFTLCAIERTLR